MYTIYLRQYLKEIKTATFVVRPNIEPVFVNVYGGQESIPGIDSANLCSLAGWYDKNGCRTGPPGRESIPGLLKRSTDTGSDVKHERYNKVYSGGEWYYSVL